VRAAVRAYADRKAPGPRPGRLLAAFVELLAATGARPNEVLALRWSDVDLLADPPTVTIAGTLIDHGRIAGKPLHRQDTRKGDAPPHTVLLPRFGVEALTALVAESGMDGPVFANRTGGWMSLTNMRRSLRAALPADLLWITPHSLRRTVATVVRDAPGQRRHSSNCHTRSWRLPRLTICSGRPVALMCGLCWTNTQVAIVETESIRKVSDHRRVADLHADSHTNCQRFLCARRDSNSQPSDP
jgi:Phage integrase family